MNFTYDCDLDFLESVMVNTADDEGSYVEQSRKEKTAKQLSTNGNAKLGVTHFFVNTYTCSL